jgi:hypothetical protein
MINPEGLEVLRNTVFRNTGYNKETLFLSLNPVVATVVLLESGGEVEPRRVPAVLEHDLLAL